MPRKTPVLLRKAGLSGRINCLTNYRRVERNGHSMIDVQTNGKHDVTNDWRALMLEDIFPTVEDSSVVTRALDGAANGMALDDEEKQGLADFRHRLVEHIEAHSKWLDAGQPYGQESH